MIKKIITSLILLLFCAFSKAQNNQVNVVCKDGTSFVGTLLQVNGTSFCTINIAGIETEISMSDVQSITPLFSTETTSSNKKSFLQSGEYTITDNNPMYPEFFNIKVDNQEIKMILVRGGVFNMGYDGRNSMSMNSEPVHKVEISSFYVSDDFINTQVACDLISINCKKAMKDAYKFTCYWDDAKKLVSEIANEQDAPYRLITEAEWEYMAILPIQTTIFANTEKYTQKHPQVPIIGVRKEWCSDLYADYTREKQVNPLGPHMNKDNSHAARIYDSTIANSKWERHKVKSTGYKEKCFVRIAISADKIPNINE